MSWIKNLFKKKQPTFPNTPHWNLYQAVINQSYSKNTLIREVRFIVLDTETTGLDPQKDKLLSFGAVAVQNQQIFLVDRFECIFQQVYICLGFNSFWSVNGFSGQNSLTT